MKRLSTNLRVALATTCLSLLLPAAASQGALLYSLRFDQSLYQVTPGSTLTVDLILSELATAGDQNRLGFYDPAADRIYGALVAEMKVSWAGGEAYVANKSAAHAGPGFTLASPTLNPDHIIMKEYQANFVGDGVVGAQLTGPPGLHELVLGQLTFTIPDVVTGDTLITLEQQTAAADNDFLIKIGPNYEDALVIDQGLTSGRALISAVPEPSSFLLLSMAATCLGWIWWRRRP